MSEVRRAATVRGVVQGVSFRWYTRHEAERLGLTGWVRNQPDGSVRFEAQGRGEDVEALIAWASQGPTHARVTGIDVDDITPTDADTGFRIVR